MTIQQREYAIERVDSILKAKRDEIEERHTQEAIRLSKQQKRRAWEQGAYELGEPKVDHRRERVTRTIDYHDQQHKKTDRDAVEEDMAPIERMAQRAKDEIMLGDDERGMKMIDAFETFAHEGAEAAKAEMGEAFLAMRDAATPDDSE